MVDINYTSFIWNVADKLRGAYRRSDYGKVIPPFSVLRRLDCALDAAKDEVLKQAESNKNEGAARAFILQNPKLID